jgi:hypothetical protein
MQHDRNTESAPDRSRSAPPALAQIAEILERLTMPSENRAYISDHAQFLVTHAALYAVQDTPRARDGGTKKAREELKILVKRAAPYVTTFFRCTGTRLPPSATSLITTILR